MPIADYFDPCLDHPNPVYRQFARDHRRRYEIVRDYLAAHPLPSGSTIIDAACGAAHGYDVIGRLGYRYIGLDRDPEFLKRAALSCPGVDFIQVDFDDAHFSPFTGLEPRAIISLETAEHLIDPIDFLRDCYQALPPLGNLFLSVPTSLTRDFIPPHRHDWSEFTWGSLLFDAGFMVISVYPLSFEAKFTDFVNTLPDHTIRDKFRVAGFLAVHPIYLANRLYNWVLRNRFYWESCLFICVKVKSASF